MYTAKEIDRMSIDELEGLGCHYGSHDTIGNNTVSVI